MRIDCSRRSIKTGIGNSPLANGSIVPWQRLDQILDRIVSVGAFVDTAARSGHLGNMGSHVDKLAATHVAASNILKYKDVSVFFKLRTWAQPGFIGAKSVGPDAIGCAAQKDGILFGRIWVIRRVDACKKLDPISHPYPNFGLGIVSADVFGPRIGLRFGVQLGPGLFIGQYY